MEKENKIVNWNGDLADLPFNDLTADEMGVFLAVCYECQGRENNLVKIELSELERLGCFYAYGKQKLRACIGVCIEGMFKKLLKFYFVYEDDKHFECFTLFTKLNIDYENNFVEISVNEPFVSLLNELRLVYTPTELIRDNELDDSELDLDDIPF